MIGDSHFDVRAAANAGIPYVFIVSADQEKFDNLDVEVFSTVEALQARIEELL